MMNRAEHIEWTKKRALAELDAGSVTYAIASVTSDLSKHAETRSHPAIELMMLLTMGGHLKTDAQVRDFIEGIR